MRGDNQQDQGGTSAGVSGTSTTCLGVVVAVTKDIVTVQVNTPEACDVCRSKASCNQSQLAGRQVEVRASGFKSGDRVKIKADSGAVVRVSVVLYLIPTLLVVVGAFAGYATAMAFASTYADTGSMIGVAIGLAFSILFVHFYKVATGDGGMDLKIERFDQE